MAEAQEIVDKLRDVLTAQDQTVTPDLRDIALSYAELCRAVNDRIHRCSQLLRQNLRTEAVHLAEASPNVLDQLTILDFSGQGDWQQLCLKYNLPEAPPLDIDSAAAINAAYAAVQPIAVLLAKHRTLALSLAPLSLRLVVMREIAKFDTHASFWEEDIRLFETHRIAEVRGLLASGDVDYGELANLKSELNSGQWRIPVPVDVVRDVDTRLKKFKADDAQRDLQRLLPELDAAYSAAEENRCRELLGACAAVMQDQKPADDIYERLKAVRTWIAGLDQARNQQQDFAAACARLEQAIDRDGETLIIQQAYKATTRIPLPIPPDLEARYKQCMAHRDRTAGRRRRMIYFGVAALTVVILAGAGLFTYLTLRSQEAHGWNNVIKSAIDKVAKNGDLADGQQILAMLAKQPASIRETPTISANMVRLKAAVAAERVRARRFASLYSRAISLKIGSARSLQLMERAKPIALRPSEIASVKTWFRHRLEYDQQQQALRDGAFNRAVTELSNKIDSRLSKNAVTKNAVAAARDLVQLEMQFKLLSTTNGVSPPIFNAEIASLQATLGRREALINHIISDDLLFQRVLSPPLSLAAYIAALNNYQSSQPNGRHSLRVRQMLQLVPGLKAVSAWADLQRPWAGHLLNPARAEARSRIAAIAAYLKAFPDSPVAIAAHAYSTYLTQGLSATAPGGPWKGRFSTVLRNRLLHGLDVWTTSNGNMYYVLPGEVISKTTFGNLEQLSFKAVTSAEIKPRTTIVLPSGVTLNSPKPERSPQSKLSRRLLHAINSMRFDQWDTIGFKTMQLMNTASSDSTSPVVRGLLLSDAITLNKRCIGRGKMRAFSNAASELTHLDLDTVNWLYPARKPIPRSVVRRVKRAFAQLPELRALIASTARLNRSMARQASFNIASLAVCQKITGDSPTFHCAVPPQDGDIAWVVMENDTGYKLRQVGVMRSGAWVMPPTLHSGITSGSLVFITSPKK